MVEDVRLPTMTTMVVILLMQYINIKEQTYKKERYHNINKIQKEKKKRRLYHHYRSILLDSTSSLVRQYIKIYISNTYSSNIITSVIIRRPYCWDCRCLFYTSRIEYNIMGNVIFQKIARGNEERRSGGGGPTVAGSVACGITTILCTYVYIPSSVDDQSTITSSNNDDSSRISLSSFNVQDYVLVL